MTAQKMIERQFGGSPLEVLDDDAKVEFAEVELFERGLLPDIENGFTFNDAVKNKGVEYGL